MMLPIAASDWVQANQQFLAAAARALRLRLEHSPAERLREAERERDAAESRLPAPSALARVQRAFGLSDFERDVLLMCAAVELESSSMPQPSFGLALGALPGAHWSAIAPQSPLRRWRLVELGAGPVTSASLRIDERILHCLTGLRQLDDRVAPMVDAIAPAAIAPSAVQAAERIASLWMGQSDGALPAAVEIRAPHASVARGVCAHAARLLGFQAFSIRAKVLPPAAAELDAFIRLWEREWVLDARVLLVEMPEADPDAASLETLSRFIEHVAAPVLMTPAPRPLSLTRPVVPLDVARPSFAELADRLAGASGEDWPAIEPIAGALNAQFALDDGQLRAAVAEARAVAGGNPDALRVALWQACRCQARSRTNALASRTEPSSSWESLVLPDPQLGLLREIGAQMRHRHRVYESWGFGGSGARGLGITALFSGPSGTGKTLAAEVIAAELKLDLYRIDLSQVVSKYIGETEKNLDVVFRDAERSGAVLFFDEADALFGKRSEVRDSHDRYANIEVGYLLQRMESYSGLAVLTTNMKEAIDRAFLRRIRFIVEFPFPDAALRAEIWKRIFPRCTPTSDLDIDALARLSITGGSIRNIALHAAFLAAEDGTSVTMKHLFRAVRVEYAKQDRQLTSAEAAAWA